MYKESLPINCPLSGAIEDERLLFRIFADENVIENNFKSYVSLHPERDHYKANCKAHGISLFDTKEVAISYIKRNPSLGNCIAEIEVTRLW